MDGQGTRWSDDSPYDREPAAPPVFDTAAASARTVALRPPLPSQAEVALLDKFFQAVAREDADRIAAVCTADAIVVSTGRAAHARLVEHWRGRMRMLHYESLGTNRPYDPSDIERFDPSDPPPLAPRRLNEAGAGDRILRVPLNLTRSGNDRLFGDELWFVLRRSGNEYRLHAIVEDFSPP